MMIKFSLIFIVIFVTILAKEEEDGKVSKTLLDVPGLGKIQGFIQKTALTRKAYLAFTAIPYAEIVKRFTPAEPVTKLTDGKHEVFDATKAQVPCIQPPNPIVPGSNATTEQCLSLNVFASSRHGHHGGINQLLPVIVFIHGGSFTKWSGNMWGGQRLLERDVVLVTINYRLGPLGFLCLGTDEAPGNAGMYDMVLALEWVQKYISHFGGDPKRVTIAGQSAGAASVTWLLDSPLAKNLFRNAIALSGTNVDDWAVQPNPIPAGLLAAKALNCSDSDMNELVECLRNVPAMDFNQIVMSFYSAPAVQDFPLTKFPKFAPVDPATSMRLGDHSSVPIIIGTTLNDASFIVSEMYTGLLVPNGLENNPTFLKDQFLSLIFKTWGYVDHPPGTLDQIATTYLGAAKDSGNFTEMIPGLIDMFGHFYFKMGAETLAKYHASKIKDVYLYSFDYFGNLTLYPYIGGVPQVPRGAAHTDDILYIFPFGNFTLPKDYAVSLNLVNAWVNFATTNNPNKRRESDRPQGDHNLWINYDLDNPQFTKIKDTLTICKNY